MRFWHLLSAASLVLTLSAPLTAGETYLDLEGKNKQVSDYKGQWIVVNYWATWCPSCVHEMPELSRFDAERNNVVVIGINAEDIEPDDLKRFVQKMKINYPIFIGKPGNSGEFGDLPGLPTTFILSPEGKVVERIVGPVNSAMLSKSIK
jgi:thiol-disulfide isomerase/thioredoxin